MNAFVEIICSIYVDSLKKNCCVFSANLGSLKGKVFLKITMFWQQWMKSNFGNWQTLKIIFLDGNNIPSWFVLDTCWICWLLTSILLQKILCWNMKPLRLVGFHFYANLYNILSSSAFSLYWKPFHDTAHGWWVKEGGSNNDCLYFYSNLSSSGNSLYPLSFRLLGHALIIWVFSTG